MLEMGEKAEIRKREVYTPEAHIFPIEPDLRLRRLPWPTVQLLFATWSLSIVQYRQARVLQTSAWCLNFFLGFFDSI